MFNRETNPLEISIVITPAEIRDKAKRLYPQAVDAWLNNTESSRYPWRIPANLELSDNRSENARNVPQLRSESKETIGYGYSIQWERRKSPKHGQNDFAVGIYFESPMDLLKLAGKQTEFKALQRQVQILGERIPELQPWIRTSWRKLLELNALGALIEVTLYLKRNPRPGCFVRELPLAIPTKCVHDNSAILTEWLNIVLPPGTIDCDCNPKNFEQRFGFRAFRKHVLMRILDPALQSELGLYTAELSLPPESIPNLPIEQTIVVIVENRINLLTLPEIERGLAFFGEGKGVTQLFHIPWLRNQPILYWGDLDVQGFEILALLRRHYPNTQSILMNMQTILDVEHLATDGTGHRPVVPSELNEFEAEAFLYLREHNLRIEQEHLMQTYVDASFSATKQYSRRL